MAHGGARWQVSHRQFAVDVRKFSHSSPCSSLGRNGPNQVVGIVPVHARRSTLPLAFTRSRARAISSRSSPPLDQVSFALEKPGLVAGERIGQRSKITNLSVEPCQRRNQSAHDRTHRFQVRPNRRLMRIGSLSRCSMHLLPTSRLQGPSRGTRLISGQERASYGGPWVGAGRQPALRGWDGRALRPATAAAPGRSRHADFR